MKILDPNSSRKSPRPVPIPTGNSKRFFFSFLGAFWDKRIFFPRGFWDKIPIFGPCGFPDFPRVWEFGTGKGKIKNPSKIRIFPDQNPWKGVGRRRKEKPQNWGIPPEKPSGKAENCEFSLRTQKAPNFTQNSPNFTQNFRNFTQISPKVPPGFSSHPRPGPARSVNFR